MGDTGSLASIVLSCVSILLLVDFSVVRGPVLCSFSRMQTTGAIRTIGHCTGSVIARRVRYWQILMRDRFCKRQGEKVSGKGIAGFFWRMGTSICTKLAFQSCFPYCFVTGYTQGFAAFPHGASWSEPGLLVRTPLSTADSFGGPLYLSASFLLRAPAARGGCTADSHARARSFSSVQQASGGVDSIGGGPKCLTALTGRRDVVELAGEVVPSRVKGPVSRFTVCLLHGLLGSRRNMRTIGSCLASPRVVALDLRNHGQSPWRDTTTVDDLARDVLHTLHECDSYFRPPYPAESPADSSKGLLSSMTSTKTAEKPPLEVVLVGHSLGGLTAMRAATLAANHAINHGCFTVHIAGIVVLDIAPIDYTTAPEQQRLRAHQEKTGTPAAEDIVRLLADLPMHLFENRKQLERTLRTATSPRLPPEIVSWLMTGALQSTADDSDDRLKIRATAAAASETTVDRCRTDTLPKNVGADCRRPSQNQKARLGWRANIHAIRRMLASKQLGWRFTDCPLLNGTGQLSHCEHGEAHQAQLWQLTGKVLETTATKATYACHRSSGDHDVAQSALESQPAAGCGVCSGPALFLKGSESPYIDLEKHWDETLRVFPNAQCKVVPGAGHWLHADKPQLTTEHMNGILFAI